MGRNAKSFWNRALAALQPYLARPPEMNCFRPVEAAEWQREQAAAARKTPRWKSHMQRNRLKRKSSPKRTPGEQFDANSVGHAIKRAVRRAFPAPADLPPAELAAWNAKHHWHFHQLRHLWATEARVIAGIESVKTALGHSSLTISEVYAERDFAAVRALMAAIG